MAYEDFNAAVVLDNGSCTMKIGFSGEERPKAVIPTVVGYRKHRRVMVQTPDKDKVLGAKAMEDRGLYKLSYPIHHGVVTDKADWQSMTELWEIAYREGLQATPADHPVLLTEAPLNPYKNRNQTAEIFFENFNVPALFFAPQPVLALYASGRLTGCVLDSGHGITQCVPICGGFALPHAITRMEVAGDDVTRYFQYQLRKNGITFHTTAELETIRMIKEKHCELKDKSPKDDDAGPPQQRSQYQYGQKKQDEEEFDAIRYELPDGKQLQIGSARYKAPEVLFNPALIGLEYRGVQYCVLDSIAKADLDLRKDLYHHILLSGGTTQIHNFGKRLLKEIQANLPEKTKIKIWAPQERTITTWIGGSLLSGLGGFRPMWIKKSEFEEHGNRILYSKALF